MMHYDPTNVNLNYQGNVYANQYPSINQPQFGTGNMYRPYQPPPPPSYITYPPQLIGGTGYVAPNVPYYRQTPLYPQQSMVIAPTYRSFWMNHILTKITPNLRIFFIISGIMYTIWSLAIIGLEVAIAVESYWTVYRSVWASGFILVGGICMLVVACRTSYSMITLIRIFMFSLCFCLLGMTLSALNYSRPEKCSSWYSNKYSCDKELVSLLKMISLILFIVVTVHTLINIIVFSRIHKKTSKSAISNISNH